MKLIEGYNIKFDFSSLIKVADLIYYDGPLLSHYMSSKGENYLFYWVDVDQEYNRWLVIRTDILSIQRYLDKRCSLRSIISQPNDGFVYVVDIDNELRFGNAKVVIIESLPNDYLPKENSFYTFEVSDDFDLLSVSRKYSSGILELHIDGTDVKYGSMPLNKFAPIIPKIEDIRKSMSHKYAKRIKLGNREVEKGKISNITREIQLDTQYEYISSWAGSVRIILKPINQQISFTSNYADDFANDIISLFESGYEKKSIAEFTELYDKNVLKKYNDFMSFLVEEKMSIGIKWCNVNSNVFREKKIGIADTKLILTNLSDFEFSNEEEISLQGRFYSVNIKTGNYSFESSEGDDFKSTGFLDETRRRMAFSISFNKDYQIKILRKESQAVSGKTSIKDQIISFVEIENKTDKIE